MTPATPLSHTSSINSISNQSAGLTPGGCCTLPACYTVTNDVMVSYACAYTGLAPVSWCAVLRNRLRRCQWQNMTVGSIHASAIVQVGVESKCNEFWL